MKFRASKKEKTRSSQKNQHYYKNAVFLHKEFESK